MIQTKVGKDVPLETKIINAEDKIVEWHNYFKGKVYVSFSGGKDSTVLLHLVRSIYPETPAVFLDTGLEFPEIRDFVKQFDNVIWLKPKMKFNDVISKYGYPIISKEIARKLNEIKTMNISDKFRDKLLNGVGPKKSGKIPNRWQKLIDAPFNISDTCCDVMKKRPVKKYEKETGNVAYVGVMHGESSLRLQSWNMYGCNAFELARPQSRPLMPFTEQDIKDYIKDFNIEICKIYSMGYERTGCMFCGFGIHLEKESRFKLLKQTHPVQYKYIMDVLKFKEVLEYIGIEHEENLMFD